MDFSHLFNVDFSKQREAGSQLNAVLYGATTRPATTAHGRDFTGAFKQVPVALTHQIASYLQGGDVAELLRAGSAFLDRRLTLLKGHDDAIQSMFAAIASKLHKEELTPLIEMLRSTLSAFDFRLFIPEKKEGFGFNSDTVRWTIAHFMVNSSRLKTISLNIGDASAIVALHPFIPDLQGLGLMASHIVEGQQHSVECRKELLELLQKAEKLTELSLATVDANALLPALKAMPHLTKFRLYHCSGVRKETVPTIVKEAPALVELVVQRDEPIPLFRSDAALEADITASLLSLSGLKELRSLHLDEFYITDEVIEALCQLPKLSRLRINNSLEKLTKKGFLLLQNLPLEELKLKHFPEDMTQEEMDQFFSRVGKGLRVFKYNGERAAPAIYFRGLAGAPMLHTIDLVNKVEKMEGAGIEWLGKLPALQVFESDCDAAMDKTFVQALGQLPSLRSICIGDDSLRFPFHLADEGWMLSALEEMDCGDVTPTPEQFRRFIGATPKLSKLSLIKIGNEEFQLIGKKKELVELEIHHSFRLTETGLECLYGLKKLSSLTLRRLDSKKVSQEAVDKLKKALPRCAVSASFAGPDDPVSGSDSDDE